jgi:hypothetical protein
MLTKWHQNAGLQMLIGLVMGFVFGFLLQKGGATDYNVILGQLLLTDFTVVKIMLSAVITGMIGVHYFRKRGWVRFHPKGGSIGMSVLGGLIFGAGFAVLGYCPGTVIGAAGQGSLDALTGGLAGMLIGSALFAFLYPKIKESVLGVGDFGKVTLPELLKVDDWMLSWIVAALLVLLLIVLEYFRL